MKAGIPVIYYPANATEEAAVPTGALVVKAGETEVKFKRASGIESAATTSTAGWVKAQATAANYVIVRPASGASLDLHIEVGGTLAAMLVANWPIPASGVDQLRIRNKSAIAQTFSATGYSGVTTADGNVATSGTYSIPVDMDVHITIDEDGWIQVAPMGQEVSQAEMDAALSGKAAASHTHALADVTGAAAVATSGTPVMDGTAVLGTAATAARSDHVHASDTSRAPTASPTFTGNIKGDGTVRLGNGQDIASQVTELVDATNVYTAAASTAATTIATTDTAVRIGRAGTSGSKWGNAMDINIGSHTAGLNAQTQVDLRLNNGAVGAPDMTVLTLKGDGQVLVSANPTAALGVATKQFTEGLVVGLLDYRGAFTPAVSSGAAGYPTTGGSGASSAIMKGDMFVASAAGFILTEAIQIGDSVLAKIDTPGQTAANWDKLNANVSYVPEDQASKVTAFSTPTDTQYPSAKLVKDQLDLKSGTSHTHAADATKQDVLVSGTNIKTINGQALPGAGNLAIGASSASVTLHGNGVGGTISAVGNDRLHTLAGSGNFTVPDGVTAVQVLVVAGGGGGGAGRYRGDLSGRPGGGGGAGGLIYNAAFAVTAGALIAYAVGTGGAGATDAADTNAGVRGAQGGNSTFGSLTAIGGGGGGGHYQVQQGVIWAVDPTTGGSGGGATNTGAGALGTAGQGNSGGIGGNGGGGGGGAGGVGGSGATVDAAGGIGTAVSITGSSVTYAAGGAGSVVSGAGNVGATGTAGRGNGGGGGSEGGSDSIASGSAPGGAGGSGAIFVRYLYQSLDTPIYANNAGAIAGGLTLGQLYRAGTDPDALHVVH